MEEENIYPIFDRMLSRKDKEYIGAMSIDGPYIN